MDLPRKQGEGMNQYERHPYYVYFKDRGDTREGDTFGVTQTPESWAIEEDRMSRADLLDLVRVNTNVVQTALVQNVSGPLTTDGPRVHIVGESSLRVEPYLKTAPNASDDDNLGELPSSSKLALDMFVMS